MKEVGIDISHHVSKSVGEFIDKKFDWVITVCDDALEICPVFPGARKSVHLPFEDPVMFDGEMPDRLIKFREVRDKIGAGMKQFLDDELTRHNRR